MAFLPALLIYTSEELTHKLSQSLADVIEFTEETGQDHFAFHIDLILPEFAKLNQCLPTLDYKDMLKELVEYYKGKQLKLNIHLMGEEYESLESLDWIVSQYEGLPVYGEIYLHHTSYSKSREIVHHAWIIGEWYNINEWSADSVLDSSEILLMTVNAGTSGQPEHLAKKIESFAIADKYPFYNFIMDGGWKVEENPLEKNRQIVVNSQYWNTK